LLNWKSKPWPEALSNSNSNFFPAFLQEAVAMIKPIEDAEEAAKRLMKEAYQRGSSDNITCVVVRFILNNQGSSSRNSSG
jgi:serine/threonine protein phosphatase PrpC